MKIYSKRKFPTLGSCSIGPDSSYSYIEEITSDKLLGLTLDNHLVWVNQIDKTYIEAGYYTASPCNILYLRMVKTIFYERAQLREFVKYCF